MHCIKNKFFSVFIIILFLLLNFNTKIFASYSYDNSINEIIKDKNYVIYKGIDNNEYLVINENANYPNLVYKSSDPHIFAVNDNSHWNIGGVYIYILDDENVFTYLSSYGWQLSGEQYQIDSILYSNQDIYILDSTEIFFLKTPVVRLTLAEQLEETMKIIFKMTRVTVPTGLTILSMLLLISMIKLVIYRMK